MAHLKLIIFRNIIMAAEEPSGKKRTRNIRNNGNNNDNYTYRVRPVPAPYAPMTSTLQQSIDDLQQRIREKEAEKNRAFEFMEKEKRLFTNYTLRNKGNQTAAVKRERKRLSVNKENAVDAWLAIDREVISLTDELTQLIRPGYVEPNHNSQGTPPENENYIPMYRANRPIVNEPLPEGFKEVPIPKPNMAECEAVDPITGSAFNPEQTVKLSDKMCYTYGAIVKQYNKRLGERRPFESPYTRKVFEEEDIAIVNTIKKMVEDGRIVLDKDDDNVTGGSKTRRRRRHILRTRKSKSRKHR